MSNACFTIQPSKLHPESHGKCSKTQNLETRIAWIWRTYIDLNRDGLLKPKNVNINKWPMYFFMRATNSSSMVGQVSMCKLKWLSRCFKPWTWIWPWLKRKQSLCRWNTSPAPLHSAIARRARPRALRSRASTKFTRALHITTAIVQSRASQFLGGLQVPWDKIRFTRWGHHQRIVDDFPKTKVVDH